MDTCRVTIGVQASLDVIFERVQGHIIASASWQGRDVQGAGRTHHEALARLKRTVEERVSAMVEEAQLGGDGQNTLNIVL